jgi:hypothetical protein
MREEIKKNLEIKIKKWAGGQGGVVYLYNFIYFLNYVNCFALNILEFIYWLI